MSTQVKTLIKFVCSLFVITFVLDFVIRNVVISSAISLLISVVYFYSPERLIAKREAEAAKEELAASNDGDKSKNLKGKKKGKQHNNKK
ncbi:MAG: hypothetical protein ACRCVJ_14895 [Clostridium sp.]|uniref:hypothetical protein n=1 Tax=Clostridium sp. TaxID=1506 RepID=UPI003F3ECD30